MNKSTTSHNSTKHHIFYAFLWYGAPLCNTTHQKRAAITHAVKQESTRSRPCCKTTDRRKTKPKEACRNVQCSASASFGYFARMPIIPWRQRHRHGLHSIPNEHRHSTTPEGQRCPAFKSQQALHLGTTVMLHNGVHTHTHSLEARSTTHILCTCNQKAFCGA